MEVAAIQMHSFGIFCEGGPYIDNIKLYYAYFKKVPTIKTIDLIDSKKIRQWLEAEVQHKIVHKHARQKYSRQKKKILYVDSIYLLDNNLLINIESHTVSILHDMEQEEMALELLLQIKRFTIRRYKTQDISLVIDGSCGLETTPLKIQKPVMEIAKNYNNDLTILHKKIVTILKKKGKSGLYLFHGLPGTGKSTYIRYLIRSINKKVIFMPPALAANLDSPGIVTLLVNNPNTVFVIEDAEELLTTRNSGRNSGISMLLNLTDGLLGESLSIQVIATFNTDLHNIDKALLRKGRLIALYAFKPLSIEKAAILLNEIGILNYVVQQPMTLADIYNLQEDSYQLKNNSMPQIGFLSNTLGTN